MNRATFLIDGFNLYHSLEEACRRTCGISVKWLDVKALCNSYLHIIRNEVNCRVDLADIHYFSSPPINHSIDKQQRHELYMRALSSTGIKIHLGKFKKKELKCKICNGKITISEEKETDVAIASRLFETCYSAEADSIVLVTGDTDIAPAVRMCQRLFPGKFICFAFPHERTNSELQLLCPRSFKISLDSYKSNQFNDSLLLPDGIILHKPEQW